MQQVIVCKTWGKDLLKRFMWESLYGKVSDPLLHLQASIPWLSVLKRYYPLALVE